MPQPSITEICLKITYLKIHSNFPRAINELRLIYESNCCKCDEYHTCPHYQMVCPFQHSTHDRASKIESKLNGECFLWHIQLDNAAHTAHIDSVQTLTVKSLIKDAPNPKNQMFLVLFCNCLCAVYWSQVLSSEWRCSWSSADRQCYNYIWVISNFNCIRCILY